MKRQIFIGWDPREIDAYQVAHYSIVKNSDPRPRISPLRLDDLRARHLYWRDHRRDGEGVLWDNISDAPMSTEFAISRFLTPHLAIEGWALFMDCDVMIRTDINRLFDLADPQFAIQVVQHDYRPAEKTKMDGQPQLRYPRKNWSSVMLFNCDHPANKALTVGLVNEATGRDLHRFCWLEDDQIGELPGSWNHLVGVDSPNPDADLVHFTLGVPSMAGYGACEFAEEWRAYQ